MSCNDTVNSSCECVGDSNIYIYIYILLVEMPMGMTNLVNTMAVNEKVFYIYTCFNGVAIKEWINIYKAVIRFVQVISKLWYEKSQETFKGNIKGGRGGKRVKGLGGG